VGAFLALDRRDLSAELGDKSQLMAMTFATFQGCRHAEVDEPSSPNRVGPQTLGTWQ
jgi:hypothetical protein